MKELGIKIAAFLVICVIILSIAQRQAQERTDFQIKIIVKNKQIKCLLNADQGDKAKCIMRKED